MAKQCGRKEEKSNNNKKERNKRLDEEEIKFASYSIVLNSTFTSVEL